jgi:hypothetical protein
MIDIAGLHLFLFFLFTYKDNGFPAIFFTSSKLYHTIYRMNQKEEAVHGPRDRKYSHRDVRHDCHVGQDNDQLRCRRL